MPKRILIVAMLVLIPAWAADGLPERIDSLLERWRDGDEAARTGVVAETLALGEPALRELYGRLNAPHEFSGPGFGLPTPAPVRQERPDRALYIEVAFWKPKGEGWGGPDEVARVIEDPQRYAGPESGERISAPHLITYEGQLANVTVSRQQSYKRGMDAEGVMQLGLMVELRAFVEEPGDRVTIDMRVLHCEQYGEMGRIESARGTVEIPHLLKRESAFVLTVEKGKLSGVRLPPLGNQGPLAVLVRAESVRPIGDR